MGRYHTFSQHKYIKFHNVKESAIAAFTKRYCICRGKDTQEKYVNTKNIMTYHLTTCTVHIINIALLRQRSTS